jgi:hypothetical protein
LVFHKAPDLLGMQGTAAFYISPGLAHPASTALLWTVLTVSRVSSDATGHPSGSGEQRRLGPAA